MSLRDSAVKGVIWTSVGSVGAGILNFVLTMVMARLLTPADFGLLELLAIFTVLSEVFIDSGFSQAVIRDQKASQDDLTSVFYFNLIVAALIYIGLFFSAPFIANFYHEEKLVDLSRFVFLTILFHSCSIIQNAIYTKQLAFKAVSVVALSSILISGSISILLALNGWGVWALAFNMVFFAFLKMLFIWIISKWRPSLKISARSIRKYFKFGVNLLVQGLVDKFVTNLESLLIGRFYTKYELGYFSQARKLDSYIYSTASSVIQKVTYPILAKVGSDEVRLKQGYRQVLGITMYTMMPILVFTMSSASYLLYCILGSQWIPSVPYLIIWCLCGLMVTFYSIFINVFLVKNQTRKLLKLSILKSIIRLFVIFLLIRISVFFLMIGILIATMIATIIYVYYGGKLISYSFSEVYSDLRKTIISSIIAGMFVYSIPIFAPISSQYVIFAIQLVVMTSIYLISSILMKNESLIELKRLLSAVLSKR